MATKWNSPSRRRLIALFGLSAALGACMTIVKPTNNQTVSSPVDIQVDWNVGMQRGTFNVVLTDQATLQSTDITSQFVTTCIPGNSGCSATASLLLGGGTYTLNASGNLSYALDYVNTNRQQSFTVVGPSFSLSATPDPLAVTTGGNKTLTIKVGRGGGFTGPVAVTLTGLPTGVTAAPATVTVPTGVASATMTIAAAPTAALGQYKPTLLGSAQTLSAQTAFTLTVVAPAPTISKVTPASQSRGGTAVIAGTGFDPICSNNSVAMGTASTTPTSCSATSISFQVPQLATFGTTSVKVNTSGQSSNTLPFRVTRQAGSFVDITADISGQTINKTCSAGTVKVDICANCTGYAAPFAATYRVAANNNQIGSVIQFRKDNQRVAGLGGAGFSLCSIGIVLDGNAQGYLPQLMALTFLDLGSGLAFQVSPYGFNYGTPSGTASYTPRILRSPDGTVLLVVTAATQGPPELVARFIDQAAGGKFIRTESIAQAGVGVAATVGSADQIMWSIASNTGSFTIP